MKMGFMPVAFLLFCLFSNINFFTLEPFDSVKKFNFFSFSIVKKFDVFVSVGMKAVISYAVMQFSRNFAALAHL